MAEPFDVPLPTTGQKPWSLNPAIEEVRGRVGEVEDYVSGPGIQDAIAEAASSVPVVDDTVATLISGDTGTRSALLEDFAPLDSSGQLVEAAVPERLSSAALTNTFNKPAVIVRPRTSFETTDTAAFNEALTQAGTLASTFGTANILWQPGREIISTGAHRRPAGVSVDFSNNTVTHTGNNVFLDCHIDGPALEWKKGVGVSRLVLKGNAGTAAVGLEVGNSYGFSLRDIVIEGYSNGIGLDLHNRANWCEGTTSQGLFIHYNKVGIRFVGSDGGTNSLGYTRLKEVSINVPDNGIGILIGPAGIGGEAYLYNASFEGTIWLDRPGATGIVAGTQANVLNLKLDIYTEGSSASGQKFFNNLGGNFRASGFVHMTGGMPSTVNLGNNLADPPTLQNVLYPPGTDGTHGGALSLLAGGSSAGSVGVGRGSNLGFGFVSGYDAPGADIFRAYSVPFGIGGNTPVANGRRQFSVDAQGVLTMFAGATTDRVSVVPRQGTPEGQSGQGKGSLALRSNGHDKGYDSLYIKTSARNTTTGWVAVQPVVKGTTAERPSSPSTGWMYFDTSLNKPIWYGNSGWVDATGASV